MLDGHVHDHVTTQSRSLKEVFSEIGIRPLDKEMVEMHMVSEEEACPKPTPFPALTRLLYNRVAQRTMGAINLSIAAMVFGVCMVAATVFLTGMTWWLIPEVALVAAGYVLWKITDYVADGDYAIHYGPAEWKERTVDFSDYTLAPLFMDPVVNLMREIAARLPDAQFSTIELWQDGELVDPVWKVRYCGEFEYFAITNMPVIVDIAR